MDVSTDPVGLEHPVLPEPDPTLGRELGLGPDALGDHPWRVVVVVGLVLQLFRNFQVVPLALAG